MVATQASITQARPRIQRDVLFTETPLGVLFHNARGGFQIKAKSAYRFAMLIVPHLDGENRVEDLCKGLAESQQKMLLGLVRALFDHGFARNVRSTDTAEIPAGTAELFSAQLLYIDHYVDDAPSRFLRFRNTRVAVIGDDEIARWCALGLVRNGAAHVAMSRRFGEVVTEAGELSAKGSPVEVGQLRSASGAFTWDDLAAYDVVVVSELDTAPRRVLSLLQAGLPEGKMLLPAWGFGNQAVVGPLMRTGTPACWVCAMLRLGADEDGHGPAAQVWSEAVLPATGQPGTAPSRPLAAMLGNLLGYEVFRVVTGALPPETEGQVLIQDLDSVDVTSEPVVAHPRCPHCAVAPATGELTEAVPVLSVPVAGPGTDADELMKQLDEHLLLVRPRAGVFRAFDDEPLKQLPLKASVLRFGLGHGGERSVAAFDVHHVVGARMRVLRRAAGIYTEHVAPARHALSGEALEAVRAFPAVDPAALVTNSGAGVPGSAIAYWSAATSLVSGARRLVPSAAVLTAGPHNADKVCAVTSAGTGAGATAGEALTRGLLSALAHDALERTLRGTAPAASVPLDALADGAELAFLVDSGRNLGLDLELLDLAAHEDGRYVLLARSGDVWALGSGLTWRSAAVAALRDAVGAAQLAQQADGPADFGDPVIRAFDPAAVVSEGTAAARLDAELSPEQVLHALRTRDMDALAVATTPSDLLAGGLHTARVVLTRGN